jgi:proton glutamate symport protein
MKSGILIKVIVAILAAILMGWLTGPDMPIFGIPIVKIYTLIGQLFLNALMLVVVPLVASSIITGTARMGSEKSFGTLGAKTFGFYILTSALAVLVGLLFAITIVPEIPHIALGVSLEEKQKIATLALQSHEDGFDKFAAILYRLIPPNIFAAAAQTQMLGLIAFCLFFGYFAAKIESHASTIVLGFWKGIFQIMMAITHVVMRALPFGVFGLVAKVVATMGTQSLHSVGYFFGIVILSLAVYAFIVLPLLLALFAQVNPLMHLRAVAPALFTAFSTSSSAASLPITIECVEKRAAVSNRICSFTVPLGASLNLSGTALYQCIAVLFIAHAYGVSFHFTTVAIVGLMALITSFGMAGVPSASLISIVIILSTIGVPADGIALILAVERILDMFRTSVNVLGNTCCAVLVARSEGEKDVLSVVPMTLSKTPE